MWLKIEIVYKVTTYRNFLGGVYQNNEQGSIHKKKVNILLSFVKIAGRYSYNPGLRHCDFCTHHDLELWNIEI